MKVRVLAWIMVAAATACGGGGETASGGGNGGGSSASSMSATTIGAGGAGPTSTGSAGATTAASGGAATSSGATTGSGGATAASTSSATSTGTGGNQTNGEKLCQLIDDYRQQNGRAAIPFSIALMTVGDDHVHDLNDHPEAHQGSCSLHSWSNFGVWTGCCYDFTAANYGCMWNKPTEITTSWGANAYPSNGYEDAAAGYPDEASALAAWEADPPHNDVLLNQGIWANITFRAMGCGSYNGYYAVWFGEMTDPQPYP